MESTQKQLFMLVELYICFELDLYTRMHVCTHTDTYLCLHVLEELALCFGCCVSLLSPNVSGLLRVLSKPCSSRSPPQSPVLCSVHWFADRVLCDSELQSLKMESKVQLIARRGD